MNTIIIATDFSETAENATRYGVALTQQIGGSVVLFHLYRPSIHVANARLSPSALDESAAQARDRLNERAAQLAEAYGVSVIPHMSVFGTFEEKVEQLFTEHHARLLVMGMAPKSLEQDLLGNTTTAIIHQYRFPVLAVPLAAEFKGISRMLFACDKLLGVSRRILDEIRVLAKSSGATVEIFHVNDRITAIRNTGDADRVIQRFGEGLEGITYYYRDVDSNSVIKAIADELERSNADLLIMLPNRYGFWSSLIHRSKTRIMAAGLKVPLLSIPLAAARNGSSA